MQASLRPTSQRISISSLDASFVFFCGALVLWLCAMIGMRTLLAEQLSGSLLLGVRILTLLILFLAEVASRDRIEAITFLGLAASTLLAIGAMQSTMNTMIDCIAFIFVSRHYDFRRIAKLCLWIFSVSLVLIVSLSFVGVIDDYIMATSERTRHYLGFRYALYPSQIGFVITSLYIYLYGKKCRWASYVLLLMMNYILYYLTDSRLSFYLSVALLVLSIVARTRLSSMLRIRPVLTCVICIFVLCAAVSIVLTIQYDASIHWMRELDSDSLLGGRLRLGQRAIDTYGITLLGQRVDLIGNGLTFSGEWVREGQYNYVDSLYVQLIVRYGLLFSLIFTLLMTLVMRTAMKACDYQLVACLIAMSLHCMVDDLSLWLYFNPFLLLIGGSLFQSRQLYKSLGAREAIAN